MTAFVVDDTVSRRRGAIRGDRPPVLGTLGRTDNCQSRRLHLAGARDGCMGCGSICRGVDHRTPRAVVRRACGDDTLRPSGSRRSTARCRRGGRGARHVVLGDAAFGEVTAFVTRSRRGARLCAARAPQPRGWARARASRCQPAVGRRDVPGLRCASDADAPLPLAAISAHLPHAPWPGATGRAADKPALCGPSAYASRIAMPKARARVRGVAAQRMARDAPRHQVHLSAYPPRRRSVPWCGSGSCAGGSNAIIKS